MRIAAPRLAARGVGWADVHVFVTKMKANSYKMFGKINFKLFRIRCFLFFIFHFSFWCCNYWIRDQLFFCLISDKGRGDGKMFVKMGYPGLGWGDTRARLGRRLPPHRHGVGGWKKIKQIGSLSFLQFPKFL